jgi:hypothetical protein
MTTAESQRELGLKYWMPDGISRGAEEAGNSSLDTFARKSSDFSLDKLRRNC